MHTHQLQQRTEKYRRARSETLELLPILTLEKPHLQKDSCIIPDIRNGLEVINQRLIET